MALGDYFLSPLGLLALGSLVPLVVLYLIRPRPAVLDIPTVRFLVVDPERAGSRPVLDGLRRSLLFLLQAAVLVLVSLAVAGPYVSSTANVADADAVVVVDASASMQTQAGGASRFDRALAAARSDLPARSTVVVAGDVPAVVARDAPREDAVTALRSVGATDAPGDLQSAVAQAVSVAAPGDRVVVYSDFADTTDWRSAVETARARGHRVELVQFDRGGADNVGIVDLSFGRTDVTATVENTGDRPATRTVRFGDQSREIELQPGDVTTLGFPVPAGGGELSLSPRDSFPTDDVTYVSAPDSTGIRVLVLTSDEDVYLTTALSVIEEVDLTVETLPTPVTEEYDVLVFSNVDPDRLLGGNLATARETLARGGGVVVASQRDLGSIPYGDLLPLDPGPVGQSNAPPETVDDPLTAGITFPPPNEYVTGELRSGQALVRTSTDTPLVVTSAQGGGQVVYYGYLDDSSEFRFDYEYPVFWKRVVYHAAGRASLEDLNRRTGDRLAFAEPTEVGTPRGTVTTTTLTLDRAGFYTVGNRRLGASLLDGAESNVTAPAVGEGGGRVVASAGQVSRETVVSLVPGAAVGGLVLVVLELVYMVRRGDL